MSKPKKKRDKRYRPRDVMANPVDWAIAGAHTFPEKTQREILARPLAALERFADGKGTRDDWNELCHAAALAEELARAHIGDNLMPEIVAGQRALDSIAHGLKAGRVEFEARTILAVREVLVVYEVQLRHCTQAEYGRAVKKVRAIIESTLPKIAREYEAMPGGGA